METNNYKIAVLSGKGGTGKTLVSVNLACCEKNSVYIDCDVEEPNGHLFFKPQITSTEDINIKIPSINNRLCQGCRRCVDFCKFSALAFTDKIIIFEKVCHSCGGCFLLCPQKALTEKSKTIGHVNKGTFGQVSVVSGILNTGEVSGVPIIKNMLKDIEDTKECIFIDCPPGSACIVMESIKDVDFCVLVAEPTIFGSHNLKMVHELVAIFKKPCGVVLNKCTEGFNPSKDYCLKNKIEILAEIPFDKELGQLNSQGFIAARESEKFKNIFTDMLKKVKDVAVL